MSAQGVQQYVQHSVRLQNEIISGVLIDMDKLRGMIIQIHQEQLHINRTFLGPQVVATRPVSVPNKPSPRNVKTSRPMSVPQKLPRIPRPPGVPRPPSRAPRKSPMRPVIIF